MGRRTSTLRKEVEDIEGEPFKMMSYFFHICYLKYTALNPPSQQPPHLSGTHLT